MHLVYVSNYTLYILCIYTVAHLYTPYTILTNQIQLYTCTSVYIYLYNIHLLYTLIILITYIHPYIPPIHIYSSYTLVPLFAGGHLPSRHNMEIPTKERFTRYRITQSRHRCDAPSSLCLLPNIPLPKRCY